MASAELLKPKLNPEFIKSIEGRDFVTYQGLLDLAHQRGLTRIEVEIVQSPTAENQLTAIVKALAETKTGEKFSDVGDADPRNTNSKVSKHLLRMASTRAKARCLRDLSNVGIACLEEISDFDEVIGENNNQSNVRQLRKRSNEKGANQTATHGNQQQTANQNNTPGNQPPPQHVAAPPQTQPQQNQQANNQSTPSSTTAPDTSDSSDGNKSKPRMSEAQNRAIASISRRRGLSTEQVDAMTIEMFGLELKHISANDASSLIRRLQQAA